MEPFGYWPRSTLRSYDLGPADQRRTVRDSEEVRKERGVIRIPDIRYDESLGAEPSRQSLDVFTREGLANAPVVLYVHGGSWVRGDKRPALFKPAALVPEGYLFASMNYRFRPRVTLLDMAQDVAAAAAWLRTHAAKYGGDGSSVFLMGHSAGAHLVSVVGTNGRFLSAAGGSLADLAGVVAIDTAMYNVPREMKQPGPAHTRVFGDDPSAWLAVSPWDHAAPDKGIPPFLLLVSDGRPTIDTQVMPMKRKLEGAGVRALVREGKGRAHTPLDTYLGVPGDESTQVLMRFLASSLNRR